MRCKAGILRNVLVLLALLSSATLYSKSSGNVCSYFAFTVSGGYSSIMTHDKLVTPFGFLGGAVGLGYEMYVSDKHFWMSVLGEAQCMTSVLSVKSAEAERLIAEDVSRLSTMDYKVGKWEDYPHCLFLSLPVMLGYRNREFYFGIGPKLSFFSFGRTMSKLKYSISSDESSDIYTDYSASNAVNIKNNPYNVAACFEIGGVVYDPSNRIGSYGREIGSYNPNVAVKLAFYAEYWLMNMNMSSGQNKLVTIQQNEAHTLDIVPLFVSNAMTNATANPLYAGLKLTVLYNPSPWKKYRHRARVY